MIFRASVHRMAIAPGSECDLTGHEHRSPLHLCRCIGFADAIFSAGDHSILRADTDDLHACTVATGDRLRHRLRSPSAEDIQVSVKRVNRSK